MLTDDSEDIEEKNSNLVNETCEAKSDARKDHSANNTPNCTADDAILEKLELLILCDEPLALSSTLSSNRNQNAFIMEKKEHESPKTRKESNRVLKERASSFGYLSTNQKFGSNENNAECKKNERAAVRENEDIFDEKTHLDTRVHSRMNIDETILKEKVVEEPKPKEKTAEEAKPKEKVVEEVKVKEKPVSEVKQKEKTVEEVKPKEKIVSEAKPKEKTAEEVKPKEKPVSEVKQKEKTDELKPKEKTSVLVKLEDKFLKKVDKSKSQQFLQYEKDVVALRNEIEKLESKKLPLFTKQASYLRKLREIDENIQKTNTIISEKEAELKRVLIKRETIKANLDVSVESLFNDSITISLPKYLRFDDVLPVFTYFCSETLPEIDKDTFEAESSHSRLACRNKLAAKSISTYPILSVVDGKEKRIGDPICDQYAIYWNKNRTVFSLADGCNWGSRPREAARRATVGFTKYLKMHLDEVKCLYDVPRLLTSALAKAHSAIMSNKVDVFEVGTTTLLGGILAPIVPISSSKSLRRYESGMNIHTVIDKNGDDVSLLYALAFISIGDCKAYRFSAETHKVTDLAPTNREGNDPTDCGGRIGPYLERGLPDIRNLTIGCYPCKPDDIIIITSDGVHDNLDPFMRGVDPDELSADFSGLTWKQAELKDPNKLSLLRSQYVTNTLAELILSAFEENEKNNQPHKSPQRGLAFTPSVICDKILDYCIETTKSTRDYFANNNDRLPKDYRKYPGKVDHTSCIVLRV